MAVTNWNLEQNVTSLTDSRRLQEAGIDLGEADGYWVEHTLGLPTFVTVFEYTELKKQSPNSCVVYVKAYRLDRLLAELPEWCFWYNYPKTSQEHVFSEQNGKLISDAVTKRGQEAIKACVELLILLKKDGGE